MLRAFRQADYSTIARQRTPALCYNARRMSTSADAGASPDLDPGAVAGASADYPPTAEERYVEAPRLTVGDGFRFGCGLLLAVVAFNFILAILAATVLLLAMLLNVPLPFGIP